MTEDEKTSLKLEAFKLAISLRPPQSISFGSIGNQKGEYTVDSLIKDSDKIYQSLLNTK